MKSQSTYETCLAWCLLNLTGRKPTIESELDIINFSLRFTKKDFTIGHLEAIHNKVESIKLYIERDFRYECNSVAQLRKSKNIKIIPCNVFNYIQMYLDLADIKLPIILYIDAFILHKHIHCPHYIIILKKENMNYHIIDPWNAKESIVQEKVIVKGIAMLKYHLGFAPRAIIVYAKSKV